MSASDELSKTIDSCQTLFLREICEPEENVLRLVVQEANASPQVETLDVCGTKFENVHRIESTERSRVFELTWNQYIAYNVTNESFSLPDDDSTKRLSGRLLRIYSKSPFLEHVSRATLATKEYPGPFTHICVVTEMHVVDVVSTQAPEIRILPAGSTTEGQTSPIKSRGTAFVRNRET